MTVKQIIARNTCTGNTRRLSHFEAYRRLMEKHGDYDFLEFTEAQIVKEVRRDNTFLLRRDLHGIRNQLRDIAEAEATYLYRLARKMENHNCSPEAVKTCREEANELHLTGYPERVITYEANDRFQYAFKIR